MKKGLFIAFLMVSIVVNSQNISYGLFGGMKYQKTGTEVKDNITLNSRFSYTIIGTYVDFQVDDKMGIKINLSYNKSEQRLGVEIKDSDRWYVFFNKINFENLEIMPLFNYDLNNSYNEGLFVTSGFKLNFILAEDSEKDKEMLDGFFNKTQFGFLLGGGTTITKYIKLELLFEYGLSNILNSNSANIKYLGGHINLNLSLDQLFKK